VFAGTACAQGVPPLVNYQGRLSNPDGTPLATADYQLTFNIYDSATNSTGLVWGPQVFDGQAEQGHGPRIPVVQGYFNVMLGPVDTSNRSLADAFYATNRFVEVTVSNHAPVLPRQQILSTPYAFQAGNAAKLTGYDWSALFGTNNPADGKVDGSRIVSNSITAAQLATMTITSNQIATGSISPDRLALSVLGTNVPAGGLAVSDSCGWFTSPTPTTPTVVSNFTVSITTSGNPVEVSFVSDGSTNLASFAASTCSGAPIVQLRLLRDLLLVGDQELYVNGSVAGGVDRIWAPPGAFKFLDSPPPGPHTYQVQFLVNSTCSVGSARYIRMLAREL